MSSQLEPYARKRLHQSALGEVMLASWRAGAGCAPHDHGGAHGVVIVLRGSLTETTWSMDEHGLRVVASRELVRGDLLTVTPGLIHAMQALDSAMTLHCYTPAIESMYVFDVGARQRLRVNGDCGAWVPEDPSQVIDRIPWSTLLLPSHGDPIHPLPRG